MFLGIFFALFSAVISAAGNYIDKFLLERYDIPPLVITIYSGFAALCLSILLILFFGFHSLPHSVIIAIILSGVFTELYILPYFKALSLEDTSTIIPLFQFIPVFVIIGDALFLGETLTILQYFGAALIVISGILLSFKKTKKNIFKPRKALYYMLLSCLFAAMSVLLFKYGVSVNNFFQILPYEGFGIALCAVCLLLLPNNFRTLLKQTKRFPKKIFLLLSIDEGIYVASRYTQLFALAFISASLVSVLVGLQPFFVLVLGIILSLFLPHILKEVISKKVLALKLIAIIFIVIGAALLSV